jgi:hypothetical protein
MNIYRYQFVELDQKGTTWKHLSLGFDRFQLGEQLAKSIQEFEFRSRVLSSHPPPLTSAIEQWSHSKPSTPTIEQWSHSLPLTQATHPSLLPTTLEQLSMPDTPNILELAYITHSVPLPERVSKEHGQSKQV